MKIQEDCFFYIDPNGVGDEKHILARCVNCQKETDEGWFWDGSIKGYSKYPINCSVCGKFINKYEEEEQNSSQK